MASALLDAARDGDLARLRALLATGVDVETRGNFGNTPLHVAAFKGQTACLKALLAAGASVDSRASSGTPLIKASIGGHAACVRALIAAGANVNHASTTDPRRVSYTSFSRALDGASRPCRRVLKILLRAGADVNTNFASRRASNTEAWALVDAIRAAGGWPQYVALNPPATFARVVKKTIPPDALPEALLLEIATFLVPAGGF